MRVTLRTGPAVWWAPNRQKWETERLLMRRYYPGWRFILDKHPYWEGELQPIPNGKSAKPILAALHHSVAILVGAEGALSIPPFIRDLSLPEEYQGLHDLNQRFRLRAYYNRPPQHPTIVLIDPPAVIEGDYGHPHFYEPEAGIGPWLPICLYNASSEIWNVYHNTIVELIDRSALWLVGHMVAQQTRHWIGPEASHDLLEIHLSTPVRFQCRCQSGLPYLECHYHKDREWLFGPQPPRLRS